MNKQAALRDALKKNPNLSAAEVRMMFPGMTAGCARQNLYLAKRDVAKAKVVPFQAQPQSEIDKIVESAGVSPAELKLLLTSSKQKPTHTHRIRSAGTRLRFGVISDAHIGHKEFDGNLFMHAVERFKAFGAEFVVDPGDHLEGMSGRPGHIYELSHIGYHAQKREAVRLYRQMQLPIFGIDGNHDLWFQEKHNMGISPGADLENEIPGYKNLGEWEGKLNVGPLQIYLFHGNDGSAYATSYKLQKLIEGFTPGEKPHLVFSGHYHKAMYGFIRGVHAFESGTLCGQTKFMRGKKISAHMGFWMIEVEYGTEGVREITPKFVPWFSHVKEVNGRIVDFERELDVA